MATSDSKKTGTKSNTETFRVHGEELLGKVKELIRESKRGIWRSRFLSMGVSMSGIVSIATGRLIFSAARGYEIRSFAFLINSTAKQNTKSR